MNAVQTASITSSKRTILGADRLTCRALTTGSLSPRSRGNNLLLGPDSEDSTSSEYAGRGESAEMKTKTRLGFARSDVCERKRSYTVGQTDEYENAILLQTDGR